MRNSTISTKDQYDEKKLSVAAIPIEPIFVIDTQNEINKQAETSDDGSVTKKVRKSLWRLPAAGGLKTVWWIYTWPIKFILTITIPNPKTFRKLYPLSFLMCIVWIGLNAYMIVWMITVIGGLKAF